MACASPSGHHGRVQGRSIVTLEYAADTSLLRASLGGQSVTGWCLAMDINSILQLFVCGSACCCATCYMSILEPEMYVTCSSEKIKNCALC